MSKSCLFAAILAMGLTVGTATNAGVVSSSATLPVLGDAYVVSGGGSRFPAAGVCFNPWAHTFTSVVPSPPAPAPFNLSGQDIVVNAFVTGDLTDLTLAPIGPVTLTGTVEQEVNGRSLSTETGSWKTDLLAVDMTGPVLGHILTMQLDSGSPSIGTTSIVPIGGGGDTGTLFQIDSFFDIFVDLSLDTTTQLTGTRHATLELVPKLASIALLTAGLAGLAVSRRGRRD